MAAPVNANINIVLNTKQATAQIRALQAEINSFNKSVIAANSAAARQQAALNKAMMDSAMASGMFNAKIVPTTAGIHRFSEALDKGKLSLSEYTRGAASQLPGMRRIFTREFDMITKVAEDRVKRLQTQYTALGNAQKAMALQPTSLAMGNMATQTALAAQKQMIFNKMISDGSTKLLNWGKNTQWAGRQLMVGFTMPLTLFGAVAAKVFMDLDKQARDFKRVYGDLFTPPAEIESNLKAIQQLGDEYTKYGVKVSDTMQVAATAAAAGMRNEKLIAGTEESLRLATIGQIDYNQALDTTISLQTAFKMSADELAPSVDFLGAVANQTVLTIDDMTKAIPRVAPVVQGLGGDVKDLAAMLVAMREGGVSAENAANGLKSGLASLINPTNAAKEKLKELGINITAIVEANKGDLMGTVMDFGTALSKLGDFERQQALEKTFGKYQYARLGALFDNIIKKGGQAEVALTLAGKSAEELGQLSAKSLKEIEESTTAKFTGAVERLKVAIAPVGEAFLKALTPVIEFITKIADKFNNLPDGVKNAIAIVTGVIAGLGPVILMSVGLIANAFANIIKFVQMLRKGFARMRGDASAFNYLAGAELDAAAAAASLEGKTSSLTSAILIQENAVRTLIGLYEKLASSAAAAARAMPTTMGGPMVGRRGGRGTAPMKMADGGVVPGSGSGDKIPALLEPGETVVTKEASQKYGPVINAMNAGNLPGYSVGKDSGSTSLLGGSSYILNPGAIMGPGNQSRFGLDIGFMTKGNDFIKSITAALAGTAMIVEKETGVVDKEAKMTASYFTMMQQEVGPAAEGIAQDIRDAWAEMTKAEKEAATIDDVIARARTRINARLDALEATGGRGAAAAKGARRFLFNPASTEDLTKYGDIRAAAVRRLPSGRMVGTSYRPSDYGDIQRGPSLMSPIQSATRFAFGGAIPPNWQYSHLVTGRFAGPQIPVQGGAFNLPAASQSEMERALQERSKSPAFPPIGTKIGKQFATNMSQSTQKELQIGSPSKVYEEITTEAAQGALVGANKSSKISKKAGTVIGQSARDAYKQEMSQLRRDMRNIGVMEKGGMTNATMQTRTLRRLADSDARREKARQSELAASEKAALLAEKNAKLAAQTSAAMQQQSAGMAQQVGTSGFFGKVVGTDPEGNPITRGQRMKSRFGRFAGGAGGGAAGMGLMGVSMMAPMLPGQAGKIGEQMQPALMGLSTLAMIGPMLMNPAGAVVAGLVAAAGALYFFNNKSNEMSENARKFSDALISGRKAVKDVAAFYGTESLARKADLKEMKKTAGKGVKSADIVKAEEFVKSDTGNSMKEGLAIALKTMSAGDASKQFANNLSSMVLQGVLNPQQAKAIATVLGEELGSKTFAMQTVGTMNEILGPDGQNLATDPLKVALEINQRNSQFNKQISASMEQITAQYQDALSLDPKNYFRDFAKTDNVFKLLLKGPLTDPLLKWAAQFDNIVGDTARGALSWFNPEFEKINTQLLTMGTTIGGQLSQSYDNLNAAKQRYLDISAQAAAIDSKDVNAKAEANLAAQKQKQQVDALTQSISDQKQALIGMLSEQTTVSTPTVTAANIPGGRNASYVMAARALKSSGQLAGTGKIETINDAGKQILKGMEDSLRTAYAENPMQAAALDMISGKLKGLNAKLNITMMTELASMQLDPQTLEKLMSLYGDRNGATIYTRILAQMEGDSAATTAFLSSLMNAGFEDEFVKRIRTESSGMSPEEIKAYTTSLQQIALIEDRNLAKSIAIESTGMNEEQLNRQNKGLEILNNLPPEIKKKVMLATNEKSALRVGKWYQNFKKQPNLVKKIYADDSQYKQALEAAGIDYAEFDALPDLQKSVVMTYIQQYQTIGAPMDAAEREARRRQLEAAKAAAEDTPPTDIPGAEDNGDGGGGGDKAKSALQELNDSINERLKLYTNFYALMKKYKGKKNAFAKAISEATLGGGLADKLRKFNLNESLIADILSKGAESAQKIINALEKRKGLAKKMNAKDILGRAGEQMNELVAGRNKAVVQTKAANMARNEGASKEALQKISESYELSYKFTKLPKEKRMKFILDVQQSIDAEKTLEYAQDPNKMLQDQIDLIKTAQDVATYANRKKIEGLQRELELVNRQISAIEELNEKDRQRIRGLERQKEMIQRQIDAYERQNEMDQRRIDALRRQDEVRNRVADALSHDLDTMSKQEQSIRDQYQERIDALNEINQLNDHIVESQKQQLGLSQALSQGDIYAAAAAAQDMQASQGQYAREQQNVALQQGMENQVAGLTTPGGLTRKQAEEQINAIKEQSYQTSLQIRDIEDQIYNRNLLMVPLKDQQYQLDLQIRDINDVIFDRETEILNIQNTKLKPLQSQIVAEQDILEAKNLVFENAISALEIEMKQNELLQKSISNVNTLAGSWSEVQKQIALANKTLAQKIQDAGPAPKQLKGVSASEFQAQVNAYKALLKQFEDEHKAAVEAAMKHGAEALASTTMYAGGYVKKYATGNYVVGSGGRDSVPAMLTPGEFVVRKAMVDKMGVPALNRINQGAISPGRMFAGGTPKFNESTGSYAIPKEFTPPKFTAPRFSIPENKMATGNIQKQAVQPSIPQYSSNTGYNNISVNVNVPQTNASPDTIANKVAMRIQDIHRRGIGNERVYKQ